jgi:hypothetical protein
VEEGRESKPLKLGPGVKARLKFNDYPSLAGSGDGAMQRIARIEDTSYLALEGGLSVGKNGLFVNVLAAGAGRLFFDRA